MVISPGLGTDMSKYFAQPDSMTCAPIAIINAMVWAKCFFSLDELPWLKKELKCGAQEVSSAALDRVLRKVGYNILSIHRHTAPTIETLEQHIRDHCGSVILTYSWQTAKSHGRHTVFIAGTFYRQFTCINDHFVALAQKRAGYMQTDPAPEAARMRSRNMLERCLTVKSKPVAWFIKMKADALK